MKENQTKVGIVIFTAQKQKLSHFYQVITNSKVMVDDDSITVLESESFELVIHLLPKEPKGSATLKRRESYVKPFFYVSSIDLIREKVLENDGYIATKAEEWTARGFKACEATDPDGTPIQFREFTSSAIS